MSDRALGPLDLGAVQARVRHHLQVAPDPHTWPEPEQLILLLAAELARLGRLVTRAPVAQLANGQRAQPTGEVCACCGGVNMQRAGACMVCLDCGTSGGCG